MLYPATHNIRILQNATWKSEFRITQDRQQLASIAVTAGVPTFTLDCHGLVAGDKVVFTSTSILKGLDLNTVYYVISDDLTTDTFKVAATLGGTTISGVCDTISGTFYVARPLDLTGYTVDSDIRTVDNASQLSTFTTAFTDIENGAFELSMTPSTSASLGLGAYPYDVSLTSSGGERYYWLKGTVTIELTYSRN